MAGDLFGNRSTLDTGDRAAFDFYPTPGWMTRSLVYHVPEIAGAAVLECASGDDAVTEVLRDEFGCRVVTNDFDLTQPAQYHLDATLEASWLQLIEQAGPFDWVVSNLPFVCAFPILQHAVKYAGVGVALLFRKTFLEPTLDRGPWLSMNPPSRIIGQPRHIFRPGVTSGGDMVACDWNVWERHPRGNVYPIEIDHIAKTRVKGSV